MGKRARREPPSELLALPASSRALRSALSQLGHDDSAASAHSMTTHVHRRFKEFGMSLQLPQRMGPDLSSDVCHFVKVLQLYIDNNDTPAKWGGII